MSSSAPPLPTSSTPSIIGTTVFEAEELRFKLPDGVTIAAKAWGPEDAEERIIAVHGFLDNAATFDRLIPLLLSQSTRNLNLNMRIVAIDLSGHGKSSHRVAQYSYDTSWIIEIITVADALGWDRFGLIGHSMGAGISLIVAGAVPKRLEFLVMLDSAGPVALEPDQVPRGMEKALSDRLRLLARQPRTYKTLDDAVSRMLQSDAKLSLEAARLLVERSTEKIAPAGIQFSHDPRLFGRGFVVLTEEVVLAYIRRVSCPVQIIWGSHRWYPLDQPKIDVRQKTFSNLLLSHVEGSHHVHLENPERVAPPLLDFLYSLRVPSARL
eukprot:TRINITY_DN4203_c0_g1_i1.p1 TRINITY_DN4203_c0_g1~~TRINITY_DN4203_c0_g1_i1.p1  ORF type:complete len:342 (-),score=114.05 TRINITY_DN4203_c0_g1_i1:34-1005(-)